MGRRIVHKCGVLAGQIGHLDMIRQKFERKGCARVMFVAAPGVANFGIADPMPYQCEYATRKISIMSHVTYTVVEHDGGWTYKVGDVFSERSPRTRRLTPPPSEQRRSNVRRGRAGRSSTRTVPAAGMRKRNAATTAPLLTSRARA
jgi:hypothetical protein